MYANEMKVIEIISNFLDLKGSLSELIDEGFGSREDFLKSKINLFNLISINSIISLKPNFSEDDLKEIIAGIQVLRCFDNLSNRKIYETIVECLKSRKYSFDEDNNVFIKDDSIEAVVSPSWLYNLVSMSKKNTFLKVFLFNKNEEMDIHDENSLLNYLYHTKMFLICMNGKHRRLADNYNHAVRNTKGVLVGKREIKSHEIKDVFSRNIPSSVKTDITKYDFNNYSMFLRKAKQGDFYNKTLKEQKEMIKQWILEDETISIEANINLSRLLFLINSDKSYDEIAKTVNLDMCMASLFKIYMYILAGMDIDYSNLYLSKIRIKNYMDEEFVKNYVSLRDLIKIINSTRYKEEITKMQEGVLEDIKTCNEFRKAGKDTENIVNYGRVKSGLDKFIERQRELEKLNEERKSIQNIIHFKKTNQPLDLAFDNDKIMDLIEDATLIGRVYVMNNNIVMEINNKEMGMNILKFVISIPDFVYFIDCTNQELKVDRTIKMAA